MAKVLRISGIILSWSLGSIMLVILASISAAFQVLPSAAILYWLIRSTYHLLKEDGLSVYKGAVHQSFGCTLLLFFLLMMGVPSHLPSNITFMIFPPAQLLVLPVGVTIGIWFIRAMLLQEGLRFRDMVFGFAYFIFGLVMTTFLMVYFFVFAGGLVAFLASILGTLITLDVLARQWYPELVLFLKTGSIIGILKLAVLFITFETAILYFVMYEFYGMSNTLLAGAIGSYGSSLVLLFSLAAMNQRKERVGFWDLLYFVSFSFIGFIGIMLVLVFTSTLDILALIAACAVMTVVFLGYEFATWKYFPELVLLQKPMFFRGPLLPREHAVNNPSERYSLAGLFEEE
jgi:hypothetical protein